MKCSSSRRVTAGLLLSFLTAISTTSALEQQPLQPPRQPSIPSNEHVFTLRNIFHHGTHKYPNLHRRLDIQPDDELAVVLDDELPRDTAPPRFTARSEVIEIERLADRRHEQIASHLDYASLTGMPRVLGAEHWTTDEVPAPDTSDKETVINLAYMAANAYVSRYGKGNWVDVGQGYNLSTDFGWEGDGLRGHIFADEKNETIIVGLKGTSVAVFDGEGTTTGDKVNDNLFFSCCCGQGGNWLWRQACNCQTDSYVCNSTCVITAMTKKTRYYSAAMELFNNITELYPTSNVWISGHSLGGSVSSLLGLTYGVPVVTFEAPGEDLAARRLGLPIPGESNGLHPFRRRLTGSRHFGHTADPVFMGSCNGALSLCSLGGYAMESKCHTGATCVYDTVKDLGWSVSLLNHKIWTVIDDVLKAYKEVPKCEPEPNCRDCKDWKFFDSNSSDPSTSSVPTTTTSPTSTWTLTRTEICRNPGWWGCLDPTSIQVTTTTLTTTSCVSPGWFGCNEDTTMTVTTTTNVPPSVSSTSTCETPGLFWGCWDETTSDAHKHHKEHPHTTTVPFTTHHSAVPPRTTGAEHTHCTTICENPGFFWGCRHPPQTKCKAVPSLTSRPSLRPPMPTRSAAPTHRKGRNHCKHEGYFWGCWDEVASTSFTSIDSATSTSTSVVSTPLASSTSSACQTPGYIWGCRD